MPLVGRRARDARSGICPNGIRRYDPFSPIDLSAGASHFTRIINTSARRQKALRHCRAIRIYYPIMTHNPAGRILPHSHTRTHTHTQTGTNISNKYPTRCRVVTAKLHVNTQRIPVLPQTGSVLGKNFANRNYVACVHARNHTQKPPGVCGCAISPAKRANS